VKIATYKNAGDQLVSFRRQTKVEHSKNVKINVDGGCSFTTLHKEYYTGPIPTSLFEVKFELPFWNSEN
jgi:hypothetical protein